MAPRTGSGTSHPRVLPHSGRHRVCRELELRRLLSDWALPPWSCSAPGLSFPFCTVRREGQLLVSNFLPSIRLWGPNRSPLRLVTTQHIAPRALEAGKIKPQQSGPLCGGGSLSPKMLQPLPPSRSQSFSPRGSGTWPKAVPGPGNLPPRGGRSPELPAPALGLPGRPAPVPLAAFSGPKGAGAHTLSHGPLCGKDTCCGSHTQKPLCARWSCTRFPRPSSSSSSL